MQPLKVEVIDWKKTISPLFLVPLLAHPFGFLISNLLRGKPLAGSLLEFGVMMLIGVAIAVFSNARMLMSGQIRRIVADESGLRVQAGSNSRRIGWQQIATCERSMRAKGKTLQRLITLRDAGGTVLVQIPRELQESAHVRAGFEAFEALLADKLGKRSFIAASLAAPLSQREFALRAPNFLVGCLNVALFLPCAVLSWRSPSGGPGTALTFLGFALLGGVLILTDARYSIDERGARCQTRFRVRELRWDQIRRVELSRGEHNLNFWGVKDALKMSGPAAWGKDGGLMMLFVFSQCEKSGIEWQSESDKLTARRDLKKQSTR